MHSGPDSVTLDYVLHVENPQDTPLYEVTLSHVPLAVFSEDRFTIYLGALDAHGAMDAAFSLTTPVELGADETSKLPLFWAGEGIDSGGAFVEFPADSGCVLAGGAPCQ